MENKAHYVVLGIFIFSLAIIGAFGVMWLGKYGENESYKYYIVNTKESVSGLNEKAPVKYRGVLVGEVKNLFINPNNSEEVSIIIKIKTNTPIKVDTYATLASQGITGLSYVLLEGGFHESKDLITSEKDMAIIQAKASLFSRLDKTFSDVATRAQSIVDNADGAVLGMKKVFNEKNIKNLEIILENIAKLSVSLNNAVSGIENQKQKISDFFDGAGEIEQKAKIALDKISVLASDFNEAVKNSGVSMMNKVSGAADNIKKLAQDIEKKFSTQNIDNLIKNNLGNPEAVLENLNDLIFQMQNFVKEYKQSPSDLLFKKQEKTLGPGEK